MSYILPCNKFNIIISPVLSLNSDASECNVNQHIPSFEHILYEKLKNNYKSFFNYENYDSMKENNFEEQFSYLYTKTMDDTQITNNKYDNSMFYEINEFVIKHKIFKNNIFKKSNILIVSKYTNEILDAIKKNNIEYENGFTFNSYDDNFLVKFNQNKHMCEFMIFDLLLEDEHLYKNFVISIMFILNNLQKNGRSIFKINLDIYSKVFEFIYFLSYLFDNISIVRLECSDNTSLYIQCDDFIINENRIDSYNKNLIMFFFLLNKMKSSKKNKFVSLFQTKVPYFFNTKLKNVKNIILQQKMEVFYNLNNFLYSSYRPNTNTNENENENENETKNNHFIQKLKQINNQKIKRTISWCKKYNISFTG